MLSPIIKYHCLKIYQLWCDMHHKIIVEKLINHANKIDSPNKLNKKRLQSTIKFDMILLGGKKHG